ncbi:MAG: hypothetical protein U1E08_06030 [Coriobacteriia bacterium]|nr:hypothetical protein [Coriobacteriia bacterium]
MGEIIGAVVFGLIGIAVLGAVLYILGMLLTGPFILVHSMIKGVHLPDHERGPRTHGGLALHS